MVRTREYTLRVLEMMDDGVLDPKMVVESLLLWMPEDEVREFYSVYELGMHEEDRQKDDLAYWKQMIECTGVKAE